MPSLEARETSKDTSYRFVYYWAGQQRKIKIGITTHDVARRRYGELATILALGRDPALEVAQITASRISIEELYQMDQAWCDGRRQPRTLKLYDYAWTLFTEIVKKKRVTDLTAAEGELFLQELRKRDFKPTSLSIVFRAVRAILDRGVHVHHVIHTNPFAGISIPHQGKDAERSKGGRQRYLTSTEIEALLELAQPNEEMHKLIRFMLLTGARPSEALDITWSAVELEHNELWLGDPNSKTKRRRRFPIGDRLRELLLSFDNPQPGERLFETISPDFRNLGKRLRRLRTEPIYSEKHPAPPPEVLERQRILRASLQGVTPYVLRHTFASHAFMNGVPVKVVSEWIGHTTAKTTELYGHLIEDISDTYTDRIKF